MSNEGTSVNEASTTVEETPDESAGSVESVAEEAVAEEALDEIDELAAARKEAQDNLEGWQRARAEFANYKKRVERDLNENYQRAALDTLGKLLPIIDDFERAMDNTPPEIKEDTWIDGISLIQRKFEKLLEEHEIVVINPVGEPFDPHCHEAIGTDDSSDVESGHVTLTLQKGYACGKYVLRPAIVRVAG